MKHAALAFLLTFLPAQTPPPAAERVGEDCASRATTHVLVRKDVFLRLDAAEQNLTKAEAALRQAQADLQAMKAAAEELQRQKTVLEQHSALLRQSFDSCAASYKAMSSSGTSVIHAASDALGAAWEAVDAPLGFAAGAGMCVGIAWGLNAATSR